MRLFVANRGEIAVRVLRSARAMGWEVVVPFTPPDRGAPHARLADLAVPVDSYMDGAGLLSAAEGARCDALHPGYGFLSENAAFADTVERSGVRWVGPPSGVIAAMGDKQAARAAMRAAGVPVVPGVESRDPAAIAAVGFPVLIKAAMGGGGRGMRRVDAAELLEAALAEAASEATAAFGDGAVYAERCVARPRHVEVQLLGDSHGQVIALGERECSIQRRHQKIVEETPSPGVSAALRERLIAAAVRAGEAVGYQSAGTVEFLVDGDEFYFLEMNTRIQVEHGITEMVSGVDLVAEQLRVCLGERIEAAETRGHAIEVRVCAEDPALGFVGSGGRITRWREPSGAGVRVDAGVDEGFVVPSVYDSLLAKVMTFGRTREEARLRLLAALAEFEVAGVPTNLEILRDIVAHPAFVAGDLSTAFLAEHFDGWTPPEVDVAALAAWALASSEAPRAEAARASSPWERLGRWP